MFSLIQCSRQAVFRHASASCEMFIGLKPSEDLVEKIISPVIFDTSFIQTVKCSFFNQIIVYKSFYGTLLTFSYFLLHGKVLCFARVGKSQGDLLDV